MSRSDPRTWWQRRLPSVGALVVVLAVTGLVTMVVARQVGEVLPDVGKDHLGDDNWTAPLGMHLGGGFQIARIPDCAAGAVTRMALWDASSQAYWEASGPPTPLTSFVVGVAPQGFTVVTPYKDPPRDALLRLVVWRKDGGPIGLRYRANDLVESRVVSMSPLQRFTISGFQTAKVCGDGTEGDQGDPATTTTLPAVAGVATTTPDTIAADPNDPAGVVIDPDATTTTVP